MRDGAEPWVGGEEVPDKIGSFDVTAVPEPDACRRSRSTTDEEGRAHRHATFVRNLASDVPPIGVKGAWANLLFLLYFLRLGSLVLVATGEALGTILAGWRT
jgi:hypothetical protein